MQVHGEGIELDKAKKYFSILTRKNMNNANLMGSSLLHIKIEINIYMYAYDNKNSSLNIIINIIDLNIFKTFLIVNSLMKHHNALY